METLLHFVVPIHKKYIQTEDMLCLSSVNKQKTKLELVTLYSVAIYDMPFL